MKKLITTPLIWLIIAMSPSARGSVGSCMRTLIWGPEKRQAEELLDKTRVVKAMIKRAKGFRPGLLRNALMERAETHFKADIEMALRIERDVSFSDHEAFKESLRNLDKVEWELDVMFCSKQLLALSSRWL